MVGCRKNREPNSMANRTHLVVMPGDGIGPEIMAATLHVLREVDRLLALGLTFEEVPIGFAGVEGARHHPARRLVRGRQARRRRHPRTGVAQRLSAGRAGRAQSVRRDAKAPRSLRQHPPGQDRGPACRRAAASRSISWWCARTPRASTPTATCSWATASSCRRRTWRSRCARSRATARRGSPRPRSGSP